MATGVAAATRLACAAMVADRMAGMIDLYSFPTSNGQRAAVMLEACGLPYRVHRVDLRAGEQQRSEFLALNPKGQIPVAVIPDGDDGKPLVITQSGAIMLWLAERTGRFLPAGGAARARTLEAFMAVMTDPAPASAAIFYVGMMTEEPVATVRDGLERRLLALLAPFDRVLAGARYLAGELSIADLALYPTVAARRGLIDPAPGLDHLKRWADELGRMPAVARGMAAAG